MRTRGVWERLTTRYGRLQIVRQVVGRRLAGAQAGQSMVEYAIVAALIAIISMVAVQALGGGVAQVFTNILNQLQAAGA